MPLKEGDYQCYTFSLCIITRHFYSAEAVRSQLSTPGNFTVLPVRNRGGKIPRSPQRRLSRFTREGGAMHRV